MSRGRGGRVAHLRPPCVPRDRDLCGSKHTRSRWWQPCFGGCGCWRLKGREGKGREGKGRETRLPTPSSGQRHLARKRHSGCCRVGKRKLHPKRKGTGTACRKGGVTEGGSSLEAAGLGSLCQAGHPQRLPLVAWQTPGGQKRGFWVSELSWGGKNFHLKHVFWCQKLTVWCFAVHGCSFLSVFAIRLSPRSEVKYCRYSGVCALCVAAFKSRNLFFPTPLAGPFLISGLRQLTLVAASLTVPLSASNLSAGKGLFCKLNPSMHVCGR